MESTISPGELTDNNVMTQGYVQSVDGCSQAVIGRYGLGESLLRRYYNHAQPELINLQGHYRSGRLPIMKIAEETEDIHEAIAALEELSRGARSIIFFGIGGSSLGGQALAQLGGWNIPGTMERGQEDRPRTRFFDNLDPLTLDGVLSSLDISTTRFVVTSKSGGTAETLAQTIAAISKVEAAGLGDRVGQMFLGITEPEQEGKANGLRALFERYGVRMLDHHTGIGGRFSCLTNVGLLPAIARGLDPFAVRAGACDVVAQMMAANKVQDSAPLQAACIALALAKEKKVKAHVMMPYSDRLGRFAHWFVQLWAESLGKRGEGTCPIAALGPLDQHSLLQLLMDGPREHLITLVRVRTEDMGSKIDPVLAEAAGASFMAGRKVGDIVSAQAHAVPDALARAGRPVRTIDVQRLDARAMGALMMHFMLETIFVGRLLDIDPFDQPAVELAKVLTRERLNQTRA